VWHVCAFRYGTGLLTCVRSALGLAATAYRRCYASTFAAVHEMQLVLFAQKLRALNLAPSHRRAHRKCIFIGACFYSLRVECAVYFQNGPARETAVDKVAVELRWPAAAEAVFDSGCFE